MASRADLGPATMSGDLGVNTAGVVSAERAGGRLWLSVRASPTSYYPAEVGIEAVWADAADA